MNSISLPAGWHQSTVAECCDILDSIRVPVNSAERAKRQGPYPYFGANGQVGFIDGYLFSGEHILLAEDGGYFDEPGKGVAYLVDGKFWVNNHAHILKCKIGISQKFVTYWFNCFDWMPYVSGTTRLKLTQGKLRNAPIFLPPDKTQQDKIVTKIEELQSHSKAAKDALGEAETLLEQLRRSVLHAAFTGKLTEKWREEHPDAEPAATLLERIRQERRKKWEAAELAKYAAKGKTPPPGWQKKYPEPVKAKTEGLPELPKGWCWASLDECGEIAGGITLNSKKRGLSDSIAPLVSVGVVQHGFLDFSAIKTVGMLSTDGEKGALEKNDILIVEGNGSQDHIGRAAIWDGSLPNARHQNHLIRLRPWTISPNHILSWLQSPTCRIFLIEKATSMSGLYNLSLSKVASIVIPIMPYNEGIFISNLIDNMICLINDSYTKLETAQSDIEKLEQSIFGKAFRGEL